jgi:hypothetical protein
MMMHMTLNENQNEIPMATTNNNNSKSKDSDDHGKDNNSKVIENLSLKLQQKNREVEQLGVNYADILEEEKRQLLCQQV